MFCIPKILKNESNSQPGDDLLNTISGCFVSQRYWKMKAIHNIKYNANYSETVVLYPKDTEKWKQFTTEADTYEWWTQVVLYPKDTEKWKQFTTTIKVFWILTKLFCIPKILKNESNSQHWYKKIVLRYGCFVSQRYWKMKAIHNILQSFLHLQLVVLYPKDTEKWKQFTT